MEQNLQEIGLQLYKQFLNFNNITMIESIVDTPDNTPYKPQLQLNDEWLTSIKKKLSTRIETPSKIVRKYALYEQNFGTIVLSPTAHVLIYRNLLPPLIADKLKQILSTLDVFESPAIQIYGKKVKIPRDQVAYGDGAYRYSGITVNLVRG